MKSTQDFTQQAKKPDQYDHFLSTYLVKKPLDKKGLKDQIFLDKDTINKWPYPYDHTGSDSQIYEEIFKKFNNHNKFGIGKTFSDAPNKTMGTYAFSGDMEKPYSPNDYSYFSFPKSITKEYYPDPKTMAHEVIHANDHQIDHLTPKIWGDLQTLYNKNPNEFDRSINSLRNKIDPTVFARSEDYSSGVVKNKMNRELNLYKKELPSGSWNPSNIKSKGEFQKKEYDWDNGLPEMQKLVNLETKRQWPNPGRQPTKSSIPNYHFKGASASEIPAFALTNLTNPWKTAEQTGTAKEPIYPLNENEQEFLHNMLGRSREAYPQPEYRSIYNAITARRHSIENTLPWKNAGRSLSPSNLTNVNYEKMQQEKPAYVSSPQNLDLGQQFQGSSNINPPQQAQDNPGVINFMKPPSLMQQSANQKSMLPNQLQQKPRSNVIINLLKTEKGYEVDNNPPPPPQMAKGGRVNTSKLQKLLLQLREMMA